VVNVNHRRQAFDMKNYLRFRRKGTVYELIAGRILAFSLESNDMLAGIATGIKM
jgi:hypothetical protein